MPKNSAEYMRAYRARKKTTPAEGEWVRLSEVQPAMLEAERLLNAEIDRLTEEVARLKRELAARPAEPRFDMSEATLLRHENSFQRFRPAPKPGKGK